MIDDTGWDPEVRGDKMSETTGLTIWKYQVPVLERFTLELPRSARVLRIDDVDGMTWLWALVDTHRAKETRTFRAFKTGAPVPDDVTLVYVGFYRVFVQMELGLYVFEELSNEEDVTEYSSPVEEAMTEWWGERCTTHQDGCPTCEAWDEYDRLRGVAMEEVSKDADEPRSIEINQFHIDEYDDGWHIINTQTKNHWSNVHGSLDVAINFLIRAMRWDDQVFYIKYRYSEIKYDRNDRTFIECGVDALPDVCYDIGELLDLIDESMG